jgi:hypothetical protein
MLIARAKRVYQNTTAIVRKRQDGAVGDGIEIATFDLSPAPLCHTHGVGKSSTMGPGASAAFANLTTTMG